VLALRELLVEAPENLHDAKCGRGHGVGEVSSGRADSAYDGHGALAFGRAEAACKPGALVESLASAGQGT